MKDPADMKYATHIAVGLSIRKSKADAHILD